LARFSPIATLNKQPVFLAPNESLKNFLKRPPQFPFLETEVNINLKYVPFEGLENLKLLAPKIYFAGLKTLEFIKRITTRV